MTPTTCGLVLAPRRLVAVVLGPGAGPRRTLRAALADDARFGLVQHLAAVDAEVVVAEGLLAADPVAPRAVEAGLVVWIAPGGLVSALAQACPSRECQHVRHHGSFAEHGLATAARASCR